MDLQKKKKAPLDLAVLTPPSTDLKQRAIDLFQKLSELKSWGNARDVRYLARAMFGKLISMAVQPVTNLVLTEDIIIESMETMLTERSHRNEAAGTTRHASRHPSLQVPQPQQRKPPNTHAPVITMKSSTPPPTTSEERQKPPPKAAGDDNDVPPESARDAKRDAGVDRKSVV